MSGASNRNFEMFLGKLEKPKTFQNFNKFEGVRFMNRAIQIRKPAKLELRDSRGC